MKKIRVIVVLMLIFVRAFAQTETTPQYLLTSKSASAQISLPKISDPYLSPLQYTGVGLGYENKSRRFFSTSNRNYSMQDKFALGAGLLLNPLSTSSMMYLGANYGWGVNYHFRLNNQFKILAGGLWDADFGFKNVSRNVNNPVNIDMSTNLNLTGLFMYDFLTRKNKIHFELALQTPIMGYMFVPMGGASYYNMFELGTLSDAFHFSSLHNKRGLNQLYSVHLPLKNVVWRFGLQFQYLKYSANNLVFKYNNMSLVIGTTLDAIYFGGKKKVPPINFISTND